MKYEIQKMNHEKSRRLPPRDTHLTLSRGMCAHLLWSFPSDAFTCSSAGGRGLYALTSILYPLSCVVYSAAPNWLCFFRLIIHHEEHEDHSEFHLLTFSFAGTRRPGQKIVRFSGILALFLRFWVFLHAFCCFLAPEG